jgi:bifunctional NMN adenylyltransferase/nudix hydrolase
MEAITYPTSFQAVDMVIYDPDKGRVLLGRKHGKHQFRFVGGFVDPADASLEDAAVREKCEEAGINLECDRPRYLFSMRMDDPRYRNSTHKVMTAVMMMTYVYGGTKAGDDIEEVAWFPVREIMDNLDTLVVSEHRPIVKRLYEEAYI